MTDIVKHVPVSQGALSLGYMTPNEAWLFAESLAKTQLLPDEYRGKPASVFWALEYGRALGLDVVTVITTIHVIKGKPTQSADLMLSRARSAGHRVRIKPERHRCVVSVVRADDPDDETVIEWTLDDAVTAGLCTLQKDGRPYSRSKNDEPQSWEKYPRAMLRSRAIAEAVRTACPEVLHGAIYTPEELGAYVDQDGNPVEAPVVPLQAVQATVVSSQRDYLHEAHQAQDADAVRRIWQAAKADGAVPEYLEQIADVGRQMAATDPVDAEVVDDDWSAALHALETAAEAAGLTRADLEEGFQTAHGVPTEQATIEALQQMTAILKAGAA